MTLAANVATIWTHLEDASTLPEKAVLWRATPPNSDKPVLNTEVWTPVSATLAGAEAWAKKSLTGGKAKIFKLVVAGKGVRAVAVGSDSSYEDEEEILLAPGIMFEKVSSVETTTASGNKVVTLRVAAEV
ncbi:hypothetical protein HXX76_014032 [Chlamydomonas incerta]|uniref:Uncharacterized protein n=1 Tax=Chlamydomonas incerta TaxID=51695 RepID=A0A835VPY3_CHLIN|nr:hypothetical protein HXX76_014032 [Chlamydomonas incerta]|eukprot:KAG2424872.1 hypothetical protein HXX76_014032 [Chlamydomonas incerta]